MPLPGDEVVNDGYAYLLGCEAGLHKIGKSKNPKRRAAGFSTLPIRIWLVHQIKTNNRHWLERKLHDDYKAYRRNGEWFDLPQAEVERLKSFDEMDAPAEGHYIRLFFDTLPKVMQEKGVFFPEIRKRTGISHGRLSEIFCYKLPNLEEFFLICDALGVSSEVFKFKPVGRPNRKRPMRYFDER